MCPDPRFVDVSTKPWEANLKTYILYYLYIVRMLMQGSRAITKKTFRKKYDPELRKGRKLNKRQQRQVKRIIDRKSELKYHYSNAGLGDITSTAVVTGADFDITQGAGDTQRNGDRITWGSSLTLNIQVRNSISSVLAPDAFNTLRFIIFQWHPNSTPLTSDILLTGSTGFIDTQSNYNHDTRQEYKILFDRTWTTCGNGLANALANPSNLVHNNKFIISLKKAKKDVQYSGGGINATNRLYVLAISDSSATPHPQIQYSTKVFFRDI